jgi:hypothetical protein
MLSSALAVAVLEETGAECVHPCLQLHSFTAQAGQQTADDAALAQALQEHLNGGSFAGQQPGSLAEPDLALARKLQEEALRESSGSSTAPFSGAHVFHPLWCTALCASNVMRGAPTGNRAGQRDI